MSTQIESSLGRLPPLGGHDHAVQFYEREEFLYATVADFLAEGLDAGEPGIVIATPEHQNGFAEALRARGFDLRKDEVVFLDARGTLAAFMTDSMPDMQRFFATIGAICESRNAPRLRAYGEMVDLLWRDGNREAAVRLEELWNELAGLYSFSLLCAYPIRNFLAESDATLFDAICNRHSRKMPTERYALANDDARSTEIVRLQQRAQALEAEIEHRKTLEKALREALEARRAAEAELRDFIDNATVGMHWVGPGGTILWANDAELKLLDRKRLEDERRRAAEDNAFLLEATTVLHRSLEVPARLRDVAALVVPRLADWCAVDLVRADGSQERLLETGEPQLAEEGDRRMAVPMKVGERLVGTLHFALEDGRRFGDGDRRLAAELAGRAAMAIENARLYDAAQAANRTKDEFLATLSHELRTPLTAIFGWARMLSIGGLDPDVTRTAIHTIEQSAKTQANLIDDLLDLSRVVTGKMALRHELVDLEGVVTSAVQTLQLAADAKDLSIEVGRPAEKAFISGDPTRMQQIAWNLLSNAIKFSRGGAVISVAIERRDGEVSLVVRDSGRGISADFLPHVFEPFRQADGTSTRTHGGLGLGLAIVKYLTELHGGTVRAESEGHGSGATFTVTLPLAS